MGTVQFEISRNRFNPYWLILGAIIGRAAGVVLAMNLGHWFFASTMSLIGWQVVLGIFFALLASFLMTSDLPIQVKLAFVGFGTGYAIALYASEIWAAGHGGLAAIDSASGVAIDWALSHTGVLGAIAGYVIGTVIWRRERKKQPINGNQTGESGEPTVGTIDS